MIDFLKYRHICLVISLSFFVVGVVGYFVKGGFNYHIDFAGGTELRVTFAKPLPSSRLRAALAKKGWEHPVIQSVGFDNTEFLIRVTGVQENMENRFKNDIKEVLPDNVVTINNVDWVGAEVGKNIQWDAIKAVILALFLILLYVAIRSEYRYALGAVAAIAHDMLAVLIVFLLLGEQISLHVLAAVLAILGYSLNDTIVIFSRVRENLKKMKGVSEEEVVNVSLNQTFRRTVLTSISTLLAVGSIFLLGGPALRGFSLAMLVGIGVGTYSSIYIAGPVVLALGSRKQ